MKIPTISGVCRVCGEDGVASFKDVRFAGHPWLTKNFYSHRDPRVCADNLQRKKDHEQKLTVFAS